MTSPSPASVEPITVADREKAKELCAKATPGPWEFDSVKTEGTYGIGDDTHEGFNEYEIVDTQGRQICSTENRDSGLSEVHDEWDEDSHTAWDEPARRDANFIAFSRTAIPAYEDRVVELEAALAAQTARAQQYQDQAAEREMEAEASEARATALLEAVSVDEVVQWLKARPGISWEATFRDIEKAVAGVLEARAVINAGAFNDR